jgi:hypothetical protein
MEDTGRSSTYFGVMNDALRNHWRYLKFSFRKHAGLVCGLLLLLFVAILRWEPLCCVACIYSYWYALEASELDRLVSVRGVNGWKAIGQASAVWEVAQSRTEISIRVEW